MAETTNIPSGDLDTAAVEAAVSGAKGPERESMEEITIKFAKGLCGEPFMSKDGKELVRIQIPNADPNDHSPWQEFVLASKQVHENQYGSGLWAKIPAEGHTTVSRPFLAGQDETGRNIWKKELRSVSNRELKEMGLDIPEVLKVLYMLRENGLDAGTDAITVAQAADEIERLYKTR